MTVRKTLMSIRVIFVLLWLGESLSIRGHSQVKSSNHFTSPETVIPLKVTGRGRNPRAGWLSYSLRFGGQKHIIHMKVKKILVSRHIPVFTYTDQYALHEDQPFIQDDCYFHGYVEGDYESLVALSTCLGSFQGILQINGLLYEIEPMKCSATFEHLIYKVDISETHSPPMRCGLTEEEIAHQLMLQKTYDITLKKSYDWWSHTRFIELAVVVDHNRFLYSLENTSVVQQDVVTVVSFVDALYKPIDINVVLVGIEIWNNGNPPLANDAKIALGEFRDWKKLHLNTRLPSDTTFLFLNQTYGITLGVAYVGTICSSTLNCGLISFVGKKLFSLALTISHELGHNLGMVHDHPWCVCGTQWCVMYPSIKYTTEFSNCSYAQYWDNTNRKAKCLSNLPLPEQVFRLTFCGNQVVEEGEECDCGTIYQCSRDPCCLPDCTLSPGASCAFGLCCKDCHFLYSGYLCRPQINECDLPEWCNGTYHQCPEDVYVKDGIPCGDRAYCYEKRCTNHDTQCKEIFGEDAKSASQSCYSDVNTQGNRFGHCSIEDRTYLKCNISDILCGRIQCENVSVLPSLHQHSTVHQVHFNGTTCWGTDYHVGMSIPDIGLVKDGSVCGLKKICIHSKCVPLSTLSQDCHPKTCNMKGSCNNKDHCHCDHGWAPPDCLLKGRGGSYDSGPPPYKEQVEIGILKHLLLFGIICLTLLFLSLFFVIFKKNKKEMGKKELLKASHKEKERMTKNKKK